MWFIVCKLILETLNSLSINQSWWAIQTPLETEGKRWCSSTTFPRVSAKSLTMYITNDARQTFIQTVKSDLFIIHY